MRKWLTGSLVAAMCTAAAAAPAAAHWRKATSDHFIIYADSSESWLRRFATKLEQFDSGFRFLRQMKPLPGEKSNRMTVYVLTNSDRVAQLCGDCGNVAGFYQPRVGGSVAFTFKRQAGENGISPQVVLFHEYSHHMLLENYSVAYPKWFSEGFAEFYSTATFDSDGAMNLGKPANHRAYALFRLSPIPLRTLLAPGSEEMDDSETESFYGRSWLLTHMLTFDDKRSGQLHEYLTLVSSGTPSLEAAKKAFGDLDKLEKELDRYLSHNRMSYFKIAGDKLHVGPIKIVETSEGQDEMMRLRIRSDRGVNRKQARDIVEDARAKAADFPNDPAVQTELAEMEYDAGNDDAAEAAADRAIAADPARRDALLYKARVEMRRALAADDHRPETWEKARSWIVKANRLDPNAAEPLLYYYRSFVDAGETPSKMARIGLERAFTLSPQDPGLRMLFIRQLLEDADVKLARKLSMALAYSPHGGNKMAKAIIEAIDAGLPGPKIVQTLDAASATQQTASKD
ncbi:hypothetical protein [Stakelama marina]|uniref:DUF1570 domain-containing protein n=1 Tax=Stakelama marina TaxID=2826939 RepID=A0A8T4IH89_9SPHN|nr:hypothetical protein [Stakelama marina]MBR0553947.1 hypothetical protein [Stakelama marina]